MTVYTYYNLFSHLLHPLCGHHVTHVSLYIASTYRWYRSHIDLLDFPNFKDPILWNYLSDCNETYTYYRGGYVEFVYQFSSESNYDNIIGIVSFKGDSCLPWSCRHTNMLKLL